MSELIEKQDVVKIINDLLVGARGAARTKLGSALFRISCLKVVQSEPSWHDLLENPDDLPTGGQHVLIAYEYDSETGKYWDCDIGEYWSCADSYGDIEGWGNTPLPVIAWKDFD